jgi:NAD-binding of NADP-dependent 3-hydroxyisobutyrate dehydrogenase/Tripartite tricarboxylate transporter family receptor
LGVFSPQLAAAVDDYPKRQIKIIVPFPAGAGPDQVARMLGQHLQDAFGQTVVIENRTSALGSIGAQEVALDGQAFLKAARESAAYSRVMDGKGDKMLARDFQPQSHISQTLKDAELILKEAQRHGLQLPMTPTQADLLRTARALAGPDSDTVIDAIRRRSNLTEGIR